MELRKTEVLPIDDQDGSKAFEDYLGQALALFVVLGTGSAAEQLVQLADDGAGSPIEPKRVLWAKNPEVVRPSIDDGALVAAAGGQLPCLQSDLGFTIKRAGATQRPRVVVDVIKPTDELDETRVFEAWAKAGG